eukprot:59117-Prorocentrum_minimum.AAC.1
MSQRFRCGLLAMCLGPVLGCELPRPNIPGPDRNRKRIPKSCFLDRKKNLTSSFYSSDHFGGELETLRGVSANIRSFPQGKREKSGSL